MTTELLIVLAGALAGGLVSGLTGFGTAMIALPIWLLVLPVTAGAPLVLVCAVAAQLQTLPAIWHAMDFRRLAPFVAGGAAGVPVGTWLLPHVGASPLRAGAGLLLTLVCGVLLAMRRRPPVIRGGGRAADALVGLGGGILGGLAGLSGPLPTIWAGLRGWDKDERRAVFQGFNLSVLSLALVSQAVAGFITAEVGRLALAALPATFVGAFLGRIVYARMSTQRFNDAVLLLLALAGAGMAAGALG